MMYYIGALCVPTIIVLILVSGLKSKIGVFEAFTDGAKEGISSVLRIFPSLLGLMVAISMLKASGTLDILSKLISPLLNFIKMPPEVFPMAIMRPVSGSGALSLLSGILKTFGPDSFIGKCASVIMGSTETTFYTVTVYYAVANIKKTRHTLPCALFADLTGIVCAVIFTRILL